MELPLIYTGRIVNLENEIQRSYDLEEEHMSPNFDRQKMQRIADLEALIESQKVLIKDHETELRLKDVKVTELAPQPVDSFSQVALDKIKELEEGR
jgi:hypothetical protein